MKPETATIVDYIRKHYQFRDLPVEGGEFYQSYIAADQISPEYLPDRYQQPHPAGSGILYLLTDDPDSFSALHLLPTDEIYHFYLGDPVEMLLLYPDGSTHVLTLGQDLRAGQEVQFVAPAGVWQGSRLKPGGEYALLGTTMAPGYIDADFTLAKQEELSMQYPSQRERILKLTR